jgi:hypothetical protein
MTRRAAPRSRASPWYFGILASLDLGCASPMPPPWVHPTAAEWRVAADRLDTLRRGLPRSPYTAVVTTVLREPKSGRTVDGRGAIAVMPGQGIRMVLVGPAGATMLDAWVTPSQWRIAVPAVSLVRRGGREAPGDLPIAFLRWWFFARFEGSLFASKALSAESLWLLRDGGAVVELRRLACGAGERIAATRRERGRAEHVDECRAHTAPSPGDAIHYVDESSGLEVDLAVEAVVGAPPDPAAFRDPDDDGDAARSRP